MSNEFLRVVDSDYTSYDIELIRPDTEIRGPMNDLGDGVHGIGGGVFDYYLAHALYQALQVAVWQQKKGKRAPKPIQILEDAVERLEAWGCIHDI